MTSNLRRFPQHFDDFVHCLSMLKLLMRSLLLYNFKEPIFLGLVSRFIFNINGLDFFIYVSGTEFIFIYSVVITKKKYVFL